MSPERSVTHVSGTDTSCGLLASRLVPFGLLLFHRLITDTGNGHRIQVCRPLGKHRQKHAWDNVSKFGSREYQISENPTSEPEFSLLFANRRIRETNNVL